MARIVTVDLRRDGGTTALVPADVRMLWRPTKTRTTPDAMILPPGFDETITGGTVTLEVDETGIDWAYEVSIVTPTDDPYGVYWRGHVQVPAGGAVGFHELPQIDPKTLDPIVEPEAAWWTAVENIKGPQGDPGPRGLPGVNAVPAVDAVATYIAEDTPVRSALNAAIDEKTGALDGVDLTAAAGWGSSSMHGLNATAPEKTVMGQLTTLLGLADAYNGGGAGEVIEQHAARAGAIPALVTVPGGIIPAQRKTFVTWENNSETRPHANRTFTGTLGGIHGSLTSLNGEGASFVRTDDGAGPAVRIPPRTPVLPDGDQYRNRFTVLWPGKNNLTSEGTASVDKVVEYTRALDRHTGGTSNRGIVLGHFVDRGRTPDLDEVKAIHAVNARYAREFGERYVDTHTLLTSEYVWHLLGISPTVGDLEDQQGGWIPLSLTTDNMHLNDAGYRAVAIVVAQRVKELGWYPDAAIPAMPAAPTIPSRLTNTAAPTITGGAGAGVTLTASNGTWSATPDAYTYQWHREGVNIPGATAKTYTTVADDLGKGISVEVTATKAGYLSGKATSARVPMYAPGTLVTVTSDTFNSPDAGTLTGRVTDAGLGGQPLAYEEAPPSVFGITGGTLTAGASHGARFLGLNVPNMVGREVSMKLTAMPTAGAFYFCALRDTYTGRTVEVRVRLYQSTMRLDVVAPNTVQTPGGTYPVAVGDTVKVRTDGTTVTLYNGNTELETITLGATVTGGYVGFSTSSGGNDYGVDDFKVARIY